MSTPTTTATIPAAELRETNPSTGSARRQLKVCQFAVAAMSVNHLLSDQILWLQKHGYDVRALSGYEDPHATLPSSGIAHDFGPLRRELSPTRILREFLWLVRYFRRHRFDVVQTHTPKAGLLGPVAARAAGVPIIFHTVHGLLYHDRQPRLRRLLGWLAECWTAAWSNQLLFQSREDWQACSRSRLFRRRHCTYIGNGISIARFQLPPYAPQERARERVRLGLRPDAFVIGYLGRMVREKGVQILLRAFAECYTRHPDLQLLLVGPLESGMQEDAIDIDEIEAWRQRLPIVFTDYRPDPERLYPLMDLFVLPSYREGIPRAAMEACTAGVAVIATRIRGCREIIEDRVTGLLYEPGNVPQLVAAIEESLVDPASRQERARRARLYALGEFDQDLVGTRILAAYQRAFERQTTCQPVKVP